MSDDGVPALEEEVAEDWVQLVACVIAIATAVESVFTFTVTPAVAEDVGLAMLTAINVCTSPHSTRCSKSSQRCPLQSQHTVLSELTTLPTVTAHGAV